MVAPALTYLGVVRRLSGRIATSEAGDLWDESTRMRLEYRDQLRDANEQIRVAHEQIRVAGERIVSLEASLLAVQEQLRDALGTILEIKETVENGR